MIEIKQISKTYRKGNKSYTALNDVSYTIEKGDFITIVGESGSGKSTLLNTVGGLIQPDSGRILYKNQDVYSLSNSEANLYREKSVGFVFQQFHLVPYLTVFENIQLVCTNNSQNQSINSYLEKCSIAALRDKYPSDLSVGEKQRTAFVRAIIKNPDILLADEPTGNLDPSNSKILMSLIEDFHQEGGTVLIVSHDPEITKNTVKSITLQSGKLV